LNPGGIRGSERAVQGKPLAIEIARKDVEKVAFQAGIFQATPTFEGWWDGAWESMIPQRRWYGRKGNTMHFEERKVGDFQIYAGAMEAPAGGYIAGVVLHRLHGRKDPPDTLLKDDSLFGGHRFESPRDALTRALDAGYRAIRTLQLAVTTPS
jgi:hypothetical protein